jgi:hypothetical protein
VAEQTQLEAERSRLQEAERRQRILSDISAILLDSVGGDEDEPLRRIVEKVVQGMGDWCAFSLVGPDGVLRQSAAYHPDPRQRDLAEKLNRIQKPRRWDAGPKDANALVQKRPLVFEEITDEMLRAGVEGEEQYQLLKEIGLASAIVAPLMNGAEPLGTLIRPRRSSTTSAPSSSRWRRTSCAPRSRRCRCTCRTSTGASRAAWWSSRSSPTRRAGESGKGAVFSFALPLGASRAAHAPAQA